MIQKMGTCERMVVTMMTDAKEMLGWLDGVQIHANASRTWDRYKVDISYKTAIVYEDGINLCMLYCGDKETLEYYGIPSEIAEEIIQFINERMMKPERETNHSNTIRKSEV